jgi:NAD-dependent SIR2 family protein deacetylase
MTDRPLDPLADLVAAGSVAVLSGAGLSTESGIPDYRSPASLARRHTPMTIKAFLAGPEAQQRYWARSHVGWPGFAAAGPNAGHHAVTALQRAGLLAGVITQNVDGLHGRAGSEGVIELHGSLGRVRCLGCGATSARSRLYDRTVAANPGWVGGVGVVNPDGDTAIDDASVRAFAVVGCEVCGGRLRPDVVFFGETVEPSTVTACAELVDGAGSLLVLGSSLTVMSGYRFVLRARAAGVPVAIVNDGATRGDPHAAVRLDGRLGDVLPALLDALGTAHPSGLLGAGPAALAG